MLLNHDDLKVLRVSIPGWNAGNDNLKLGGLFPGGENSLIVPPAVLRLVPTLSGGENKGVLAAAERPHPYKTVRLSGIFDHHVLGPVGHFLPDLRLTVQKDRIFSPGCNIGGKIADGALNPQPGCQQQRERGQKQGFFSEYTHFTVLPQDGELLSARASQPHACSSWA